MRHRRGVQIFGGALLIVIGVLLVTGLWQSLNTWLQTELVGGFEVWL
jgi:cytochrome c-type biogenesis protein